MTTGRDVTSSDVISGRQDAELRKQIKRNLGPGLDAMGRLIGSLAQDDQQLIPIQAGTSWSNLDRVSSQIHTKQMMNERVQEVLAVYRKWTSDVISGIKKQIATLEASVNIRKDEQTEVQEQEVHTAQLLKKFEDDLQKAEEQLRKKTSQNWRVTRMLTNALANCEIEAKKAHLMMAQFSTEHANRYRETVERNQEIQDSIREASREHEKFVMELCEVDEELNQLKTCHEQEKHQARDLQGMAELLDPLAIYCNVLCEVCQLYPADHLVIYPVLEELRGSLGRCLTPEALELEAVKEEQETLQVLLTTVDSWVENKAVPSLGFEDLSSELLTDNFSSGHSSLASGLAYLTGGLTPLTGGLTSLASGLTSMSSGLTSLISGHLYRSQPSLESEIDVSDLVGDEDPPDVFYRKEDQVEDISPFAPLRRLNSHRSCDLLDSSCDQEAGASWEGSHTVSRGVSHDPEVCLTLVAPGNQEILNIQGYILKMQKLTDGSEDTDFSLSEFPPQAGFEHLDWPSSFQASLIQLNSSWIYCLTATRNAFLSFQLYTRLINVCLIQANQAVQLGKTEDLELLLNQTVPLLEKISHKITSVARKVENNFETVTGIVGEMTETCQVATGRAGNHQRELSVREDVNLEQSQLTGEQIQELIAQRRRLVEGIRKAEQEFAQVVLELPGVWNLLSTTAADRCASGLHKVSRFFRKVSEKLVNLQFLGVFQTGWKELKSMGSDLKEYFSADVVDDSQETTTYVQGAEAAQLSEEVAMETLLYLEVLKIKPAVDTMVQMLLDNQSLNIQRCDDTVWETQARLEGNQRVLNPKKKTTHKNKNKKQMKKSQEHQVMEELVSRLQVVCERVLEESKSMHQTPGGYEEVLADLTDIQDQLQLLSVTLKNKLDSRKEEMNSSPTLVTPTQEHKGFLVLERVATQRFAKGKTLHVTLRRHDRVTQDLTSQYDVQRETASVLASLASELNQLGRTLDLLGRASTHLTNLQTDMQTVRTFSQSVCNVIQTPLSNSVTKVIRQLRGCLATMRRTDDMDRPDCGLPFQHARMVQSEIHRARVTAYRVHEASKAFLQQGQPPREEEQRGHQRELEGHQTHHQQRELKRALNPREVDLHPKVDPAYCWS